MSTSREYLDALGAPQGDWTDAIREYREMYGSHAADYIAALAGRSRRTAERYLVKGEGRAGQAVTPPPAIQQKLVQAGGDIRASQRMLAAQQIHVGRVEVAYPEDGRHQGTRNIGTLPIQGELATAVEHAAALVLAGSYGDAAEILDAAILAEYGVPEGALEVVNYENGIWFE